MLLFARRLHIRYVASAPRAARANTTIRTGVSNGVELCVCLTAVVDDTDATETEAELDVLPHCVTVEERKEDG